MFLLLLAFSVKYVLRSCGAGAYPPCRHTGYCYCSDDCSGTTYGMPFLNDEFNDISGCYPGRICTEYEQCIPPTPTPNETPNQTPHETPDITPYQSPYQTPHETPDLTPYQSPYQTPYETPDLTPYQTCSATPNATIFKTEEPSISFMIIQEQPDRFFQYLYIGLSLFAFWIIITIIIICCCCKKKKQIESTTESSSPEIIQLWPENHFPATITVNEDSDPFAEDFVVSDSYFDAMDQD